MGHLCGWGSAGAWFRRGLALAGCVLGLFAVPGQMPGQSPWAVWTNADVYYNGGRVSVGVTGTSQGVGTLNALTGILTVATVDGGASYGSQFAAQALGTAQGQRAVYSLYPTFQGTTDNAPRRAADIVGGYNGCPWGCEYLSFNVGLNGGNNGGLLNIERMRITGAGNVGIGTTNPVHLLQVAGTIGATEVIVSATGADYVFDPAYPLMPLGEMAAFIKANRHLPGIPSAAEVKEKGVSVGEMESKLLAKVEELTLQMIQMSEENKKLKERLEKLEKAK